MDSDPSMNVADFPIMVTGAAGRVWSVASPTVGVATDRLTLVDRVGSTAGEVVVGDLDDPQFRQSTMAGQDAVLHLAVSCDPHSQLDRCLAELGRICAVIDSAIEAGVSRFVYASSVHAMGLYNRPGRYPVMAEWAPAPCCPYGTMKAGAEAYLRSRAAMFDAVVIVRLGLTGWGRGGPSDAGLYLSDGDAGRLLGASLTTESPFTVCFGTSANTARHWSLDTAIEIGYRPRDDFARSGPDHVHERPGQWPRLCQLKSDLPHPAGRPAPHAHHDEVKGTQQ